MRYPVFVSTSTVASYTPKHRTQKKMQPSPLPAPNVHVARSVEDDPVRPVASHANSQPGTSSLTLQPMDGSAAERIVRILRSQRSPVHLGFTIYSISRVQPVEQSFDADIRIYCRWRDDRLAADPDMVALRTKCCLANGTKIPRRLDGNFPESVVKEIDPAIVAKTRPRYELANAKSVDVVSGSEICYLSPNDELGWVTLETRYRGTFQQNFNLIPFPFDVQQLCIIVRMSAFPDRGKRFVPFELKGVGQQNEVKSWIKLAEWTRYEPTCIFEDDSRGRARCTIQMLLCRKSRFHVLNVMLVNFCITLGSFFAICIPLDMVGERLSVASTMFLTAIAFKIVVANDVPKVSYSTIMDLYLNGCLSFMFAIITSTACVAFATRSSQINFHPDASSLVGGVWTNDADLYILGAFIALFALFHVWIFRQICKAKASNQFALDGRKTATDASDGLRAALQRSIESDRLASRRDLMLATGPSPDDEPYSDELCDATWHEDMSVRSSEEADGLADEGRKFTKSRRASRLQQDANLSGSFKKQNGQNAIDPSPGDSSSNGVPLRTHEDHSAPCSERSSRSVDARGKMARSKSRRAPKPQNDTNLSGSFDKDKDKRADSGDDATGLANPAAVHSAHSILHRVCGAEAITWSSSSCVPYVTTTASTDDCMGV